jgi:type II secretory pathway component PulJ
VVVYNDAGLPETVQYRKVNAMLLNEVQRQQRQIAAQQEQIDALLTRLAAVERRLDTN